MSFNLIVDVGLVVICLINAVIIAINGPGNTALSRAFIVVTLLLLVMFIVGDYIS